MNNREQAGGRVIPIDGAEAERMIGVANRTAIESHAIELAVGGLDGRSIRDAAVAAILSAVEGVQRR